MHLRYPLELVKLLPGAMSFAKLTPDQTNAMLKCGTLSTNAHALRLNLMSLQSRQSDPTTDSPSCGPAPLN